MISETDVLRLYRPPDVCGEGRCQSELWELIYCLAVPAAVLLVILVILSRVMCCKSCKSCSKKKDSGKTDDLLMENYNSIRRASATVRLMSYNRETAMLGDRCGSMTLDRSYRRNKYRDNCNSAPGTLQRQQRNRRAERNSSVEPPAYSSVTETAGALQSKLRQLDREQATPPPPPPYSNHTDDVFYNSPDFLGSDKKSQRSGVRYEETEQSNQSNTLLLPTNLYQ